MIEESINYVTRAEDSDRTLIVGGGIAAVAGLIGAVVGLITFLTLGLGIILFPFVLVPWIFLVGYYMRILGRTGSGNDELPSFDRFGDLLKKGAVYCLLLFVYYLVPLGIVAVSALLGVGIGGDGGGILAILGILLAGVLSLGLTYVFPAALTHYATEDDIMAAFAFSDIVAIVSTTDYVMAWLFGFALFFGAGLLAFGLGLIPFIGAILASALQFVIGIPAFRAFGLAYRKGSRAATQSEPSAAPAVD